MVPGKVGKSKLSAEAEGVQHYQHDQLDEKCHSVHHLHLAHVEVFDAPAFLERTNLVGFFLRNIKLACDLNLEL